MRRGAPALAALALGAALVPGLLEGAAVKIWVADTAADFSLGEARGISVSSNGSLLLGRNLVKVEGITEPVLFAGTVVPKGGDLLVATGDSGVVLRVTESGKSTAEVKLPEQEVTAVAVGPDGAVYAGASPGGKVYRIQNGKSALYYDTKAQYVWALAFVS